MIKRIMMLIVAALFAMSVMAPAAFATHNGPAHGNQTVVQECETKSDNQPRGQQPVCKGQGLEQEQETLNRGGNAPGGQNR